MFIRIFFILLLYSSSLCNAIANQEIVLIRDIESEELIANIAKPLFHSAKIDCNSIDVYVINRKDLNAFVTNGNSIFVHMGLITFGDNTDELNGVLAHEIGHIVNNHLMKIYVKDDDKTAIGHMAGYVVAVSMALSGVPLLAPLALVGAQSYIDVMDSLRYSRNYEREADIVAISLLQKNKRSSDGLYHTMSYLHNNYGLGGSKSATKIVIPYLQTHPLTDSRLEFFKMNAVYSKIVGGGDDIEYQFCRVKAKLCAFYGCHFNVDRCLINQEQKAFAKQYFTIHQLWREKKISLAKYNAESLLSQYPNDVMLIETVANINYEGQNTAESIRLYKKVVKLLPNNFSAKLFLAQMLVYSEDQQNITNGITILRNLRFTKKDPSISQLLEYAYNAVGEKVLSELFFAERMYYQDQCYKVRNLIEDKRIIATVNECKKKNSQNLNKDSNCKLIINLFDDLVHDCNNKM